MNLSQFGHLPNLIHGISTFKVLGQPTSIKPTQQRIDSLLRTIDLVRQLRAQCVHPHLRSQTDQFFTVSRDLSRQTKKLCKDRQLGALEDRRALEQEVIELIDSAPSNTLASNLVQHGRVIRSLIYMLDKQMMGLMQQSDALHLAGEYNEQWMRIMSAIDALTQYRIVLSDSQYISLLRVTGRGMVLESKLHEVNQQINLYQFEQHSCLEHLKQVNSYKGLKGTEETIVHQLYTLSSTISALLLEAYRQAITKTCEQVQTHHEKKWSA